MTDTNTDRGGAVDLSAELKRIRDKFLIPTPDKDFTDYAILTRCIAALAQPTPQTDTDAREKVLSDLLDRAEEELRLIRSKDSSAVYDTTLRLDLSLRRQALAALKTGDA